MFHHTMCTFSLMTSGDSAYYKILFQTLFCLNILRFLLQFITSISFVLTGNTVGVFSCISVQSVTVSDYKPTDVV